MLKRIIDYKKYIEEHINVKYCPTVGKLNISSHSAMCKLSDSVNLDDMIDKLSDMLGDSIRGLKYKSICLGNIKQKIKSDRKTIKNTSKHLEYNKHGNFYNQASIIVVRPDKPNRYVNIKFFTNGGISMTGCQKPEDGIWSVEEVLRCAKLDSVKICEFNITLINCDYSVNYRINREKFYDILIDKYSLCACYDPESYPRVKISYMWNSTKKIQDGICECSRDCICGGGKRCQCSEGCRGRKMKEGKRSGYSDKSCKEITVAVSESGKVLITGGQSNQQVNDCYNFMNTIFRDNYSELVRFSIIDFDVNGEITKS